MQTSNTKLTPEQKQCLKSLKAQLQNVTIKTDGKTTIAYQEKGNTVEFALSVMSPNEKKFRAKVGEFFALNAFVNSKTVKMGGFDFLCMMDTIFGLEI
jgi:hypothetical protein